jgi:hypothetical protein
MTPRSTSALAGPTRTTRLCPASPHHAVNSLTQGLTPDDGLSVSETTAKWPESASAANHILIFVTDSPPIRHSCEKFVILFENLQACRFSFPVSYRDPLTCGDARCLRSCHSRFVSNACHFSEPVRSHAETSDRSSGPTFRCLRAIPSRDSRN